MNTQSESVPKSTEELGLGAILVNALPPTLFTDKAPEHYTVAAVFTRHPTRSEIAAIHSEATRDVLRAAGYPAVSVRESNWRLEIADTNLDDLTRGLAGVIAERLHVISEASAADGQRIAAAASAASQRESDRAALVALAAAGVTFARPIPEREGASSWDSEGGAQSSGHAATSERGQVTPE